MTDPTKKNPENELRIDREKNLIFIPGQDEPKPLIAPIQQRFDADGNPYQHVVSATELIQAEEQHNRCMKFVSNVMAQQWKCTQCGVVRPGTELACSAQMLDLLREMMQPGGHQVDWNSIVEHLEEHLLCPDAKCKAPVTEVVPYLVRREVT